ncbi:MAG: transporter substrate-binding domain-containing protein [Desulfurococcaceae archaeon]
MKKVLLVGADPYPPYQFIENGELKGIDYEVIRDVINSMGYTGVFVIQEWGIIEELFNRKKLDIAFQVTKTPEREKKWIFSSEKLRDAKEIIVASERCRHNFNDLRELIEYIKQEGLKLGVMRGYRYGEPIDSLPIYLKSEHGTVDEVLSSVNLGSICYSIIDLGIAKYFIKRKGLTGIKVLENLGITRALYVIFNDTALRDEFDRHIKLYREELYNKYFKKYLA